MAKRARTSITDLVGKKTTKPSLDEINKIADQIHEVKPVEKAKPKAPSRTRAAASKKAKPDLSGRFKRISLNAPLELYLDIQRDATLQDKSMMQYILDIVEKDIAKRK